MTTTLPLVAVTKIDTRKNGDIAWVRATVLLDGTETGADFRARVGEEPVVIDGDTITVSDAQVATLRSSRTRVATQIAQRAAEDAAKLDAAIAKLDAFLTQKNASSAAADELRAFTRANAAAAIDVYDRGYQAFSAERRAIMVRHGLM